MKILVAPDKFKSSLTADEVAQCIGDSLLHRNHQVIAIPLADGGEGTSKILTGISGGSTVLVTANDPLFRPVNCSYGVSSDGFTAFIEMAEASGLWRLKKEELNPATTSTWGTGELIMHACKSGVREIILGCGGSATHDGGCGMAAALGWEFFNEKGISFVPVGHNLDEIVEISGKNKFPILDEIIFKVISDVENPLTGLNGAAHTFGPQKGAGAALVEKLDSGLLHLDRLFHKSSGYYFNDLPGAGAGGGLGAGARFFLNASWELGINFLLNRLGLEDRVIEADLVITGEGKLDPQSLKGKVISGLAELCHRHHKPMWIVCGINEFDKIPEELPAVTKILSLSAAAGSEQAAIEDPAFWLEKVIRDTE